MSRPGKVVWYEGMFLKPHHFQQWDAYYEDALRFHLSALTSCHWGLTQLQINGEALSDGIFLLERCEGVLPDGLQVRIPEIDKAPGARTDIGEYFPTGSETMDVYLAIPLERDGQVMCDLEGNQSPDEVRYMREFREIADENTMEKNEVGFARKNLKILFFSDDESLHGHSAIKIAELVRTASGSFALTESYVPPCLSISASDYLKSTVRDLYYFLSTQSTEFSSQFRVLSSGSRSFTSADVTNFWLLHTINSFIPLLGHVERMEAGHPETLYCLLVQLAAQLTTFSAGSHPRHLPAYDHKDLFACFDGLSERIRTLVKSTPERIVTIPLRDVEFEGEEVLRADIEEEQLGELFDVARFYLRFTTDQPDRHDQLMQEIPGQVKIASQSMIDRFVGNALIGVELLYESRPPDPLYTEPGVLCFRLLTDPDAAHWQSILQSRSIAIFLQGAISEFLPGKPPEGREVELLALKE